MHGQFPGPYAEDVYRPSVCCQKKERGEYRSVIFPAARALEGALFCERWHKDEAEIVQVLERILHGAADVAAVLDQAQSIGWLGKLELTDAEAVLLGWRPELLGD
jgi:hypothetical protein